MALHCSDLDLSLKILLVGSGGVGKSSLIRRYTKSLFNPLYKKTIGVEYAERICTTSMHGDVRMMLWDTAGQEEFDKITRDYYDGANAVVLVFSVTDRPSFDAVKAWKRKVDSVILSSSSTNADTITKPDVILIMNKIDAVASSALTTTNGLTLASSDASFVVTEEEARQLALDLDVPMYTVSVKDNVNVEQVFQFLAESFAKRVHLAGGIQNIVAKAPTNKPPTSGFGIITSILILLRFAYKSKSTDISQLDDKSNIIPPTSPTLRVSKSAEPGTTEKQTVKSPHRPASTSRVGGVKSPTKDKECVLM